MPTLQESLAFLNRPENKAAVLVLRSGGRSPEGLVLLESKQVLAQVVWDITRRCGHPSNELAVLWDARGDFDQVKLPPPPKERDLFRPPPIPDSAYDPRIKLWKGCCD